MNVKLQWVTPNAEEFILYNARVSSPETRETNTSTGLLGYCLRNGHWSVFEQANMCVEIKTSRAISAQIIRHRSFSFQEFSQRYAKVQGVEPIQLRRQATNNRQSSTEEFDPVLYIYEDSADCEMGSEAVATVLEIIQYEYDRLIKAGVAKECARMILPMASSTVLHMNGTIRSWIHYLNIRDDEHAQLEHQIIAREIKAIFREQFPVTSEALAWL